MASWMASFKNEEEKLEVQSLIRQAFGEECAFDRKNKLKLLTLAISPHEVSWSFKLRERIHRFIHHN